MAVILFLFDSNFFHGYSFDGHSLPRSIRGTNTKTFNIVNIGGFCLPTEFPRFGHTFLEKIELQHVVADPF